MSEHTPTSIVTDNIIMLRKCYTAIQNIVDTYKDEEEHAQLLSEIRTAIDNSVEIVAQDPKQAAELIRVLAGTVEA